MPLSILRTPLRRRRLNSLLVCAAVGWTSSAKSTEISNLSAEATRVATLFLDLVDAGKSEEATSRYVNTAIGAGSPGGTPEERHSRIQAYIVARLGVGAISNRRIVDVKPVGIGARVLVRYSAPENPREGTNNRRLARHNEYVDIAAQQDGTARVIGFGFAD